MNKIIISLVLIFCAGRFQALFCMKPFCNNIELSLSNSMLQHRYYWLLSSQAGVQRLKTKLAEENLLPEERMHCQSQLRIKRALCEYYFGQVISWQNKVKAAEKALQSNL